MYQLIEAGIEAFDVYTKSNSFAGMLVKSSRGDWKLYWNSNATSGSSRKFANPTSAIEFMHNRRASKGWRTV